MKINPTLCVAFGLTVILGIGVGHGATLPSLDFPNDPVVQRVALPQPDPLAIIPSLDVSSLATISRLGPPGCPTTPRMLVERAKEAWARQDVNVLASLYHWHEQGGVQAAEMMNAWAFWLKDPVVAIGPWTEVVAGEDPHPDQRESDQSGSEQSAPDEDAPDSSQTDPPEQGNFIRFSDSQDQEAVPYVAQGEGIAPFAPTYNKVIGIDIVQQVGVDRVRHVRGRFVKDPDLKCFWLDQLHEGGAGVYEQTAYSQPSNNDEDHNMNTQDPNLGNDDNTQNDPSPQSQDGFIQQFEQPPQETPQEQQDDKALKDPYWDHIPPSG